MNAFSSSPAPAMPPEQRRPWPRILVWVLAILFSAGLNLFLFGIMPGMISAVPNGPDSLDDVQAMAVVRVKRVEAPARRKERPKPPKPVPPKTMPRKQIQASQPRPDITPQRLPFELNAGLPVTDFAFSLPPVAKFEMAGPAMKDFYLADELDAPLVALVKVPPIYPIRASRRGIQGWVTVSFLVNANGLVDDIQVVAAKPKGVFDQAVVKCISQWKFKPGTIDGQTVVTRVKTTLRFKLEGDS